MVLKKTPSEGLWSVESNGETEQSISADTKPVTKKSKKRKSAQIGTGGGEAGDDTRKPVVNASPAKKVKKEQQSKGSKNKNSPIKAPKKAISRAGDAAHVDFKGGKNHSLMDKLKRPCDNMTQEAIENWNKKASEYLKTWKRNSTEWKFSMKIQNWMVRTMLDDTKMRDNIFPLFLENIAFANPAVLDCVHQLASNAINNVAADMPDSTAVVRARLIKAVKPTDLKDSN